MLEWLPLVILLMNEEEEDDDYIQPTEAPEYYEYTKIGLWLTLLMAVCIVGAFAVVSLLCGEWSWEILAFVGLPLLGIPAVMTAGAALLKL